MKRNPSEVGGAARRQPRSLPTSATCKTCGAVILVPKGWSIGPATRRHYWSKHRDVMQPKLGMGGGGRG